MQDRSRVRFQRGPLARAKANLAARDLGDWERAEEELVASCHPRQRDLVDDPSNRIVAIEPRGWGKTTAILARAAKRIRKTARARFLYIATSRTQGEVLIWEPLKQLNERMKLGLTFNETKMTARYLKTGGTFRVVGADDKREIEKLRGQPFHEVWIDEAASHPVQILDSLITRVIGPRLGDYQGTLGMIGTPGPVQAGPFYESTLPGLLDKDGRPYSRPYTERGRSEFEGWDRWSLHTGHLADNTKAGHEARKCPPSCALPHMWEEALNEKKRNGWSDNHPVWRREFLAQWAADDTENVYRYRPHDETGRPWNQWDPVKDPAGFAIGSLPKGHRWFFVWGADMGARDPFALEVFAYSDTYPELLHVYEFSRAPMYVKDIAELILGENAVKRIRAGEVGVSADGNSVQGRTGYPMGACADIAGLGESILGELKRDYGIVFEPAPRAAGDKHAGIELFNGDLVDGKIKVMKGSILETQLQTNQWAKDDNGWLKENKGQRNDAADAAVMARRKALHQFQRTVEAPPPAPGSREAINQGAQAAVDKMMPRNPLDSLMGPNDLTRYFDDWNV